MEWWQSLLIFLGVILIFLLFIRFLDWRLSKKDNAVWERMGKREDGRRAAREREAKTGSDYTPPPPGSTTTYGAV